MPAGHRAGAGLSRGDGGAYPPIGLLLVTLAAVLAMRGGSAEEREAFLTAVR